MHPFVRGIYRGWWLGVIHLVLLVTTPVTAAEAPSHFEQANRLYEQGKFTEAASLYESMLKAGRRTAAVFFNLGNAYFKKGELGRAIFNYRRAERLAPRDPDIQANLRFTRERVTGTVSVPSEFWQRPFRLFTLNEITAATTVLFWLWAAMACMTRLRPALKARLRTASIAACSFWILGLLFLGLASVIGTEEFAIVTVKEATVHLGPLSESQAAFTAPNGSELRLRARREGWLQVTDRSDRVGWLTATNALIFTAQAPQ